MMTPKSLLELTTRYLYENFEKYDRHKLKTMLAPLVTIREMTLANFRQECHESCVDGARCVDRFLTAWSTLFKSKYCLKLDQADLIMCYRSNFCNNTLFQEVVRNLPYHAPNLQDINMADFGAELSLSLHEREIDAIVKLTRLTRLDMSGISMSMSGFFKIMEHCKKLEYIYAEISNQEVELPGTLIREDFTDYWIGGFGIHEGRIPISLQKNALVEGDLTIRGRNLKQRFMIDIDSLCIAKLGFMKNLYSHITHLRVTQVRLCDLPEGEFETMAQSPHDPDVHFDVAAARAFKNFTIDIGQNLVQLFIIGTPFGKITLEQLSMWCPNLEELDLFETDLYGNSEPLENLRCLQEFNCFRAECGEDTPVGSILMAPLLKSFMVVDVAFASCKYNIGDRDALIGRIARREILKNLDRFCLNTAHDEMMRSDFADEDEFYSEIIEIIKHCRVTE